MSINIVEFQKEVIGVIVYKSLKPEMESKGGGFKTLHENAWVSYSNAELFADRAIMQSLGFEMIFKGKTVFSDKIHILDSEGNIVKVKKAGEQGNIDVAFLPEMKLIMEGR